MSFLHGCQSYLQAVLIPNLAYKVLVQAINIRVQDLPLVLSVTRALLINKGLNDKKKKKKKNFMSLESQKVHVVF